MSLAISKAWQYQGLTYPNPAVGALVVYRDKIVALEAHQRAGSSHAEPLALLSAYESISKKSIEFDRFDAMLAHKFLLELPKGFFGDTTLYITLEPCSHIGKTPSCASLLAELKPKRVIIAQKDPIESHSGGIERLIEARIEVELEEDRGARELIEPFLIWQKRAFVLFKLAQTTNGRIGGGYLSSKESLTSVHQIREVCDTLLIGGNTVRVDRPTLDCRFIDAKAPNIKIYSHSDNFDRDIPLFNIPNRAVDVVDTLEFLDSPSFVLVEGGEGMLEAIGDRVDWLLLYQTPMVSSHPLGYNIDMGLEFLHTDKKGVDMMIWSCIDRGRDRCWL
jgi:diaminohydroxyphosphoribosylaminopyrimidine deaminase/5-amino-6-(5-phosphoribosylamino)uracil reductase